MRLITLAALIGIGAAAFSPVQARADGGEIAAGIFGGLAVGALLGAATAPRHYAPAPVYVEPAPVYVAPPPSCYWVRGEPVWDGWRGAWVRPHMQVCD